MLGNQLAICMFFHSKNPNCFTSARPPAAFFKTKLVRTKQLINCGPSPKTYWPIMKTFYNGKKAPLIPLLLVNDKLQCDFRKKQIIPMSFLHQSVLH